MRAMDSRIISYGVQATDYHWSRAARESGDIDVAFFTAIANSRGARAGLREANGGGGDMKQVIQITEIRAHGSIAPAQRVADASRIIDDHPELLVWPGREKALEAICADTGCLDSPCRHSELEEGIVAVRFLAIRFEELGLDREYTYDNEWLGGPDKEAWTTFHVSLVDANDQ